MREQAEKVIEENAEKYDLCSCLGDSLVDEVIAIGDDHYAKNDGEILPLEKILEMIEDREEQRLSRFKSSKKFGTPAIQDASRGTTSPTLTNNNKASAPIELHGLTGDARMNAIIKKFRQG